MFLCSLLGLLLLRNEFSINLENFKLQNQTFRLIRHEPEDVLEHVC